VGVVMALKEQDAPRILFIVFYCLMLVMMHPGPCEAPTHPHV